MNSNDSQNGIIQAKGNNMFLDKSEQGARAKALEEIMGMLDSREGDKIKGKAVIAEVSPKEAIIDPTASHDAVEGSEESLFPAEEEKEDVAMEGSEPSEQEKAMIKELFLKYCS